MSDVVKMIGFLGSGSILIFLAGGAAISYGQTDAEAIELEVD